MPRISSKPRIVFKQQITREVHFKIRVSDEIINRLAIEEKNNSSTAVSVSEGCLKLLIGFESNPSNPFIPKEVITIPTEREVVRHWRGADQASFWVDGKVLHVVFYHDGRPRIVKPSKAA